jgi:rhodanese-related sulfurtransferase
MREIDARAAMAMVKAGEAVVVDVREPGEFAGGHLPGAHNIPLGQLSGARLEPQAGKTLLLVCASGMRSARGCAALGPQTGAVSLAGGVKAWRAAGGEVEGSGAGVIPLDRQVLIAAGALVLFGVLMSLFVSPRWVLLSGFVGAGLMFAGLSGFCGMATLLAKAPWNRGSGPASAS